MSESERDIHRPDGDLATSTPPDGQPPVDDPYAHHAYAPEESEPTPKRRRRRREKREPDGEAPAAPADDGEGERELGDVAPVIPLQRESLLHDDSGPRNVRIRKLRVLGVLFGLGILAVVSTIFGMLMALTSDLP